MRPLVRVLLVLLLVHGLVPDLAEIGEAVVHYARTGHLAHSADDQGDLGDLGTEHGCGTTQHRCACCPAQEAAPAAGTTVATLEAPASRQPAVPEARLAARAPDRPFRPPIS